MAIAKKSTDFNLLHEKTSHCCLQSHRKFCDWAPRPPATAPAPRYPCAGPSRLLFRLVDPPAPDYLCMYLLVSRDMDSDETDVSKLSEHLVIWCQSSIITRSVSRNSISVKCNADASVAIRDKTPDTMHGNSSINVRSKSTSANPCFE